MKIAIFYAIFASFINIYAGDGIGSDFGKNAAGKVCDALEKNKEGISETTIEAAKVLGSDAAEKLGSNAVGKLGEVVKTVGTVTAATYVIVQVVNMGKDAYVYMNPTEEKKNSEAKAAEEYKLLTTKREFRECLMKNAYTRKNKSGLPAACDECGITFSMTAGVAEYQEMSDRYKSTYKDL